MSILVLNAGSSTLKFALFDDEAKASLCHGAVDWRGQQNTATLELKSKSLTELAIVHAEVRGYDEAIRLICQTLRENNFHEQIRAVGHRVVHGATEFQESVVIDQSVIQRLQNISQLAPLHLPPLLKSLEGTFAELPDAKQVAVFDTTFFKSLPEQAIIYPVPYQWHEQYGIRRFGFHGISHSYCSTRAAQMLERVGDPTLRLIVCHLGSGSSATAIIGGSPIQTTMGFTPLEGLMMGTRGGSIDPGIMIYLMQEHGLTIQEIAEQLNHHSGLLGVSGVSSDYRELEKLASASNHDGSERVKLDGSERGKLDGSERAKLGIEMFADRIRSTIGALAVSMGGVDALIFTAGIGENSASLRERVCEGLGCLGIHLDLNTNNTIQPDGDVATATSTARILVIRTKEEQMIASEVNRISLYKLRNNVGE